MSKQTRKKLLLAKIESVYGTDPTLAGANAMQVKNLEETPLNAELVNRDLVRPFLGNSENLIASRSVQVNFEVELVGRGQVGVAPAFDALLRACGFAKTITQVSCSIVVADEVATVTKVAHGYSEGDKVLISGCTDAALNIVAELTSVPDADTFTYDAPGAGDASPAAGAPKINSAVSYQPISSGFESVALRYNLDGIDQLILGARGTVSIGLNVKQIPTFRFSFTGLYSKPTDAAPATADYSAFMIPQVVNTQNTPVFSLLGYSGAAESLSIDMANEIYYKVLVGDESIELVDRKPSGTIVMELPSIATKDFFAAADSQTTGALALTQGSRNGYKVELAASGVLIGNPAFADNNGVAMISLPITLNPVSGNDELSITFK